MEPANISLFDHPDSKAQSRRLPSYVDSWGSRWDHGTRKVDCLRSARFVVAQGRSYDETVRAAIALGDDTDTTAAVAGGIAGLRYGVAGIPARWRTALRGMPIAAPLIQRLVAHA
jgi:ADP-ribosylglycohydrolase